MEIIINHGTFGSPSENWFPWLSKQLQSIGHKVVVPSYPTPENQSLQSWLNVFEQQVGKNTIDDRYILIGHSLGSAFNLRLLERAQRQIRACVLVSSFVNRLGLAEFDKLNSDFIEADFNWDKIRRSAKSFLIYHSQNDPYVPLSLAFQIADHLESKVCIIDNGGHLNTAAGFSEFPKLFKDLKTLIFSQDC